MCLKSFNLPGLFALPSCCHFSLVWPPFHALVVKPSTSTFTAHLSNVLDKISAESAAIVIGLHQVYLPLDQTPKIYSVLPVIFSANDLQV